ncbi:MAG: hypothetical protein K2G40_08485, partial [Muribaculaceae bacterium]|nr:hypothetical protein [Muribaculaceae bacterium]
LVGCIVVFELFTPVIVRVLYSNSFDNVVPYLLFSSIGTPLRAYAVILAYIMLARGDGKIYIITESLSAVLYIVLNMAGYTLWGLSGTGIAYVIWYLAYSVSVTVVYHYYYRYPFPKEVIGITLCVAIVTTFQSTLCLWQCYVCASIVALTVAIVSFTIFYRSHLARSMKK